MWKTIEHILMSPNATVILVFIVFIVIVAVALSKTGLLNIHTKAVEIGATNKEREIIRRQIEWVKRHCEGMEGKLPKSEDYNTWRGRYIAEKVYDEYVEWITLNHLTTEKEDIEIRQDRIVGLVNSLTEKKEFKTKKFEEILREDTKIAIEKLVQIRNIYK